MLKLVETKWVKIVNEELDLIWRYSIRSENRDFAHKREVSHVWAMLSQLELGSIFTKNLFVCSLFSLLLILAVELPIYGSGFEKKAHAVV